MALKRLTYVSRSIGFPKDALGSILAVSRRNNSAAGITGALIFNDTTFLQILEGDAATLTDTFVRIAGDDRHEDIELVALTSATKRYFATWSMHAIGIGDPANAKVRKYTADGELDPSRMNAETIEAMCLEIAGAATPGEGRSVKLFRRA